MPQDIMCFPTKRVYLNPSSGLPWRVDLTPFIPQHQVMLRDAKRPPWYPSCGSLFVSTQTCKGPVRSTQP